MIGKKSNSGRKSKNHGISASGANDEIKIYISPITFVMAIYFVFMGMAYEFVCSLAAVLLHECAHAKVAKKLGYRLNLVKLMPYGAALCGDVDMSPKHETTIAAAGPIFNLVVATALAALWWLLPASYLFTQTFCFCNLYVGLFNIIPVYPLDGGRIALALMSVKIKRSRAYKIMRIVSAVAGIAAITVFGICAAYALNLCLLSVGLFMLVSAFIPDRRAQYKALFDFCNCGERFRTPLEVRRYALSSSAVLADACRMLDPDRFTEFCVLDGNNKTCLRFDEYELLRTVKACGYSDSVMCVRQTDVGK